jgi:5-hydroxyisourate hydrolase-like protein (transthyretin family)
MDLVTRRFLLGALPSTIVLAALPAWPALAANPGLTTHMLDTMNGIPAEGVKIDFSVLEGETYRLIATMRTNADGRTPAPLLNADTMKVGRYQLILRRGVFRQARRGASRSAIRRSRRHPVRDHRCRRALSRAAARLALELHHLPRQLS